MYISNEVKLVSKIKWNFIAHPQTLKEQVSSFARGCPLGGKQEATLPQQQRVYTASSSTSFFFFNITPDGKVLRVNLPANWSTHVDYRLAAASSLRNYAKKFTTFSLLRDNNNNNNNSTSALAQSASNFLRNSKTRNNVDSPASILYYVWVGDAGVGI